MAELALLQAEKSYLSEPDNNHWIECKQCETEVYFEEEQNCIECGAFLCKQCDIYGKSTCDQCFETK